MYLENVALLTNLLASLAAVDGAVILGRDLTIHGFGAEIRAIPESNEDETIQYAPLPHGKPPDRPLSSFGMRHRSAYRFCQRVRGSLVFVVSQDGELRLLRNEDGKVSLIEDISHNIWGCVFRTTPN